MLVTALPPQRIADRVAAALVGWGWRRPGAPLPGSLGGSPGVASRASRLGRVYCVGRGCSALEFGEGAILNRMMELPPNSTSPIVHLDDLPIDHIHRIAVILWANRRDLLGHSIIETRSSYTQGC